jgi:hypothetical protein
MIMHALVIILWLLPLAAWTLPRITASVRRALHGRGGYAFALLAGAAAGYAFPARAAKSTTNPPPAAPSGVIRLYYHAPDGRLVPFHSPIRRYP